MNYIVNNKKQKSSIGIMVCCAVIVLIPGLVFAGSTTNKGANPNGKPFVELGGQIVEIEGEISSLQDQIDSLVGRVGTVEDAQAAMASAITALKEENATLQAVMDSNASDIDALETEISALNTAIMVLEQNILDLGDADGSLQAEIDANEARVTTLALSIDTLKGELQSSIDNNVALIEVMQERIDNFEASVAFSQNLLAGNCQDGYVVSGVQEDGTLTCVLNENGSTGSISVLYKWAQYRYPLKPGRGAHWSASCPIGYFPTGGGHHLSPGVELNDSRSHGNSWWIWVINRNSYTELRDLWVQVNCIRLN